MKNKKYIFPILLVTFCVTSCSKTPVIERIKHKDYYGYSIKVDGKTYENLNWEQSYDNLIKLALSTKGTARDEYLHQAEDLLMSTGAIIPLYKYQNTFLMKTGLKGAIVDIQGHQFFQYATLNGNGEFSVCVAAHSDNIDPAANSSSDGSTLILNCFEGIYKWVLDEDTETPYDAKLVLSDQMAKEPECEEQPDGSEIWKFTFRDDLKWADGDPLDARDFMYSWNRAACGPYDYAYMFDCIEGYDTRTQGGTLSGLSTSEDGKTLIVKLSHPVNYWKDLLAFPTYMPVKKSIVESDQSWHTKSADLTNKKGYISNGPLVITTMSSDTGHSYVLTKNPNYVSKDKVKATKVTFLTEEKDTTIVTNYINGAISFAGRVPNNQIDDLSKKYPDEFFKADLLGTYYSNFNVNDSTLNNVAPTEKELSIIRRGLSLLINRDYITKYITHAGIPVNSFVPTGCLDSEGNDFASKNGPNRDGKGYYLLATADMKDGTYKACVDQAVELLKSAGWKFNESTKKFEGIPTIEYITNNTSDHIAIAEHIQAVFHVYGIEMKIEQQEWNTFLSTRKNGKFCIARNGWSADYRDAKTFLETFTSTSGNNDAQLGK